LGHIPPILPRSCPLARLRHSLSRGRDVVLHEFLDIIVIIDRNGGIREYRNCARM
jgi:hypothetical protein